MRRRSLGRKAHELCKEPVIATSRIDGAHHRVSLARTSGAIGEDACRDAIKHGGGHRPHLLEDARLRGAPAEYLIELPHVRRNLTSYPTAQHQHAIALHGECHTRFCLLKHCATLGGRHCRAAACGSHRAGRLFEGYARSFLHAQIAREHLKLSGSSRPAEVERRLARRRRLSADGTCLSQRRFAAPALYLSFFQRNDRVVRLCTRFGARFGLVFREGRGTLGGCARLRGRALSRARLFHGGVSLGSHCFDGCTLGLLSSCRRGVRFLGLGLSGRDTRA
eukprot:scaffold48928_cov25-Tisochrysis_lutea.AAC.2